MLARSSIVRAVALPPFLLLIALSLSVLTPTTAQAFTTPKPVTIAGALKSPPVRIFSMTPWGRGITLVAGLGLTAYETKDSWFPVVKEMFNSKEKTTSDRPGWSITSQWCGGGTPEFQLSGGDNNSGGLFLDTPCQASNRDGKQDPGWSVRATAQCKTPDGTLIQNDYVTNPPSLPKSEPPPTIKAGVTSKWVSNLIYPINAICPAGKVPYQILFQTTQALMNNVPDLMVTGLNGGVPDLGYTQSATVRCKKPDGTIATVTDSMAGQPDKIFVPSCAERHPGSVPVGGTLTTPVGGVDFNLNNDLATQWGQCFGPSGLVCKTEVHVDGQRCLMGSSVCIIWHDIWKADPERVQCRFGPYDVPTTDCANLRYAYQKAHTITKTTTADPQTDPAADPDAPPKGSPEINPNPQPDPSPQPSPNPNPNPNPQPNPTAGPNPEAPPTTPTPETNPDSRSCYADAWSWNPVDWVYVPVKCALKWAFVPRPGFYETKINGLKTQFDASTLGNYLGVVQGMVPAGASGCQGPEFRVGDSGSHYPMSACSGSPATLAASSRLILTIAISLGAGFACLRILGRSIGWDPAIGGERA